MAEIVALREGLGPLPRTSNEAVVKELRLLLEMAEAGEIQGIAFSCIHNDDLTSNNYIGAHSRRQVGSLFSLMTKITSSIDSP